MAWFQNLADKAEDFLNKIDQNAATVLNESSSKFLDVHSNIIEPKTEYGISSPETSIIILNEKEGNLDNLLSLEGKHNENASNKLEYTLEDTSNSSLNTTQFNTQSIKDKSLFENYVVPMKVFEKELKADYSTLSSKSGSAVNSNQMSDELQTKMEENISRLEAENQEISQQLLNIQHLYSETNNENINLLAQLERANEIVSAAQNEMEQYKARAQRILQEKEILIAFKKEVETDENTCILATYNEELKKELEFQQEKNKELIEKVNVMNTELIALQEQLVETHASNLKNKQNLQNVLSTEKKYRLCAEEECRTKTKELHSTIIEVAQLQNLVKNKNKELDDLKQQLKQRSSNKINNNIDSRLQSLTQTLMTKQNALEVVTTERNALRIQLEKLDNDYHKLLQNQRTQILPLNINDTDDAKSQVPKLTVVSPLDDGVTRRVKHTISTLDAISIRTGVFLRRYPLARIFVFCYMILLHIWVLIILFTYVPSH